MRSCDTSSCPILTLEPPPKKAGSFLFKQAWLPYLVLRKICGGRWRRHQIGCALVDRREPSRPQMTPVEARFEIEPKLVALAAENGGHV